MAIEYKKNNKARFKVYIGLDLNGRSQFASKTITYTTKKDARRQYEQFVHDVKTGAVNAGTSISLSELMDRVIDTLRRNGRAETTLRGYEVNKRRIIDTLGDPPARKISPLHVETWLDDITERFSPKTVRNTVFFLSQCFAYGMRWRLVTANPLQDVELPPANTPEAVILTAGEIGPFVAALREDESLDYLVAYELALFCGLRRSEILGLYESDIDLTAGSLQVTRSRHEINGREMIQPPKTKKSNRGVAVPGFVLDDIRALKKQHRQNEIASAAYSRSGFLIRDNLGSPLKPNRLTDELRRFTGRHGFPSVTPHGLRHTHASLVFFLGHDLAETSAQLGHSNTITTANIYVHALQGTTAATRSIAQDLDAEYRSGAL